ncbi:unnamed protein product, partial [Polarella glacialis]
IGLRKKTYDFKRTTDLVNSWHRWHKQRQMDPEQANLSVDAERFLGPIVEAERKPIDLRGKSVLAPLTTVGNLPFRRLCVQLGCEVTVGEMALSYSILEGQQVMTKVAQFVDENVDCDFLDINCGCPLDEASDIRMWLFAVSVYPLKLTVQVNDSRLPFRELAAAMAKSKEVSAAMPEVDSLGFIKFLPLFLLGLIIPRAIGGAIALAIYKFGKTALYDKNMAGLGLAESENGYLYAAAAVFGFLVSWLNNYPVLYKNMVMRFSSGNLRANMMIFKEDGKEGAPYVVLETE